jgi:DNA-binding transcriptional ArsR family regulator
MTPAEAERAYGRKPAGSHGRPRTFASFAAYVEHRVAALSDPVMLATLVDTTRQLQENTLSRSARNAARQTLNRRLTECDPVLVEQLREALADLRADTSPTPAPTIVGVNEAARQLGVSPSTVSRKLSAGAIPNRGTRDRPLVDLDEARRSLRRTYLRRAAV